MKGRNIYVDLMRILMSFFIVLYHYNYYIYSWKHPFIAPGGYRCVDVFLIIAGYYFMRSLQSNKWGTFGVFIKQRLKRLYPAYIFIYILTILTKAMTHSLPIIEGGNGLIGKYKYVIFDVLLIQNWGIWDGVSVAGWYVSALLLGMILLYFIFTKIDEKKALKLVGGGIVIFGTSAIIILHGNLCVSNVRARFISMGVCRALIGLGMGCLAYVFRNKIKREKVILLLSFCMIMLEMIILPRTAMDVFILIFGALFIIEAEKEKNTFPDWFVKLSGYLGRLSYIVFLSEGIAKTLCDSYKKEYSLCFYIIAVLLISCVIDFILNKLLTRILKSRRKLT